MAFYIQYTNEGTIIGGFHDFSRNGPICENQLCFDGFVPWEGKMVDVSVEPPVLIDVPAPDPLPDSPPE